MPRKRASHTKRKDQPRKHATKNHKPEGRLRAKHNAPRTAKQFAAMPHRSQDRWNRVTQAVSKMRAHGASLTQASKEFGLAPRTVVRLAKPALRKGRNGRYSARSTDKLLRVLTIPSSDGLREIAVRDSRQASRAGKSWAAVRKYLQTGDGTGVENLPWKYITDASGKRIRLLTDLAALDKLASAGVLSFESLYTGVA